MSISVFINELLKKYEYMIKQLHYCMKYFDSNILNIGIRRIHAYNFENKCNFRTTIT